MWYCVICCKIKVISYVLLTFESVDDILNCHYFK